jgi:hypothetical protein
VVLADRGGELELFHPGKVGHDPRKVKGRKGRLLGWIRVFVGRVLAPIEEKYSGKTTQG